jgi:hypothetical protein
VDELELARKLLNKKRPNLNKKIDKLDNSEINKEHIVYAAISEAKKYLVKRKIKTNKSVKLGWWYWQNNESVLVKTSEKNYRNMYVYGHGHPIINMKFETKHDVNKSTVKYLKLMGYKLKKRKDRNGWDVHIGS